jgi:hypothetical protein
MPQQLYSQAALDRLSSPEQLDRLMRVTSPRAWVALAAVWVVIGCAIVWGFVGSIPTTVAGQGLIVRSGGVSQVQVPFTGQVEDLLVNVGDIVTKGQHVATVRQLDGAGSRQLFAPATGRIVEVLLAPGAMTSAGQPALSVEFDDRDLQAIMFVPATQGKQIKPGMPVQVSPSTAKKEEFGVMAGTVTSVSPFPMSAAALSRYLGNEELVRIMTKDGPQIEVRVDLARDPHTPSGYRWSSRQGPPDPIASGTLLSGNIVTRAQRPIGMVLPILRRYIPALPA